MRLLATCLQTEHSTGRLTHYDINMLFNNHIGDGKINIELLNNLRYIIIINNGKLGASKTIYLFF